LKRLDYEELIRQLFPRLTGGIRWGLDRTERMRASGGDPHRRFLSVHIAGTNGKGSTAATIEAVLRHAGRRVGLYSSPHLCTFRERIRIDGQPIGKGALLRAAEQLWPAIEQEAPSFFEATTAIAFLALAEAAVDVAVVEVGLGGRLDATNVVVPEVVGITDIALDHAEYLGPTIAQIAAEKAGVIKPGVPVVAAAGEAAALPVIRARAESLAAPLRFVAPDEARTVNVAENGTSFRLDTRWGELALRTPLIGLHQARNAALAVRILEALPAGLRPDAAAVGRGVARVHWPGRLQMVRRGASRWIFDAAHNPAGIGALADSVSTLDLPRPRVLLVGILADKDWAGMLPPLLDWADVALLTVPETAPEGRRWQPEAVIVGLSRHPRLDIARAVPVFAEALAQAEAMAGPDGTVLVTGSFHTVGDALARLDLARWGVDPPLPLSSSGV
jgi:dihydrofolate synthase / folylpolyglutamate synthase